ncbi:MAG TPA: ferric reductase-like transmembrane domain-containing protein [Acidimicrobiia bacterium]|nr:ferric reductase-like transmembrane domain-containing protein [Acidimicrobiia bacterium]
MTATMNPQVWWWLARATGIVAWCTVTASIVWGLTLSSKLVRRRKVPAWLLDLHRYLGTLTLVFVGVHLAALVADSYVDFSVRDLFVPMASAWRPGAVAWGIVAFYLLLLVQISSWCMKRLPRRVWHRIHLASFAVFVAGTVHAALAGADRTELAVQFAAVAGTTVVVFLVFLRVLNASGAVADRDERIRRPPAPAAAPATEALPAR